MSAWSQIEKPPEFENPSFRSGGAAPGDGSSHVSALGETVSLNLIRSLAEFEKGIGNEQERRSFQSALGLLRQRMVAAAVPAFRQAVQQHPESVPHRCGLAVALYLSGDMDESASLLVQLAERHPDQLLLAPILGETATSSPAHKPAIERRLRIYVSSAPKHAGARYHLAELLANGQPEPPTEAIDLWQEAARLDPQDARPCLALARVEQNRDHAAAAIRWLHCALERNPDSAEAHYQLARLYFRTGRRDLGNKHLERFHSLRK